MKIHVPSFLLNNLDYTWWKTFEPLILIPANKYKTYIEIQVAMYWKTSHFDNYAFGKITQHKIIAWWWPEVVNNPLEHIKKHNLKRLNGPSSLDDDQHVAEIVWESENEEKHIHSSNATNLLLVTQKKFQMREITKSL